MERLEEKEPSIELLAAASLAAQNAKQATIAAVLKMSQPAVSRLLSEARDKKILIDAAPQFADHLFSRERLEQVERRISHAQLGEALAEVAEFESFHVRVFSAGGVSTERIDRFGEEVAGYVKRVVGKSEVLGVSWGYHLYSAFDKIGPIVDSVGSGEMKIVPLAGEPIKQSPTRFSSTSLAAQLQALMMKKRDKSTKNGEIRTLSLAAVPAFIVPLDLADTELNGIWKYIERVGSYAEIFGGRTRNSESSEHLVNCMDTILTGIGTQPLGYGSDGMIPDDDLKRLGLSKLALGDIGGVLIPKGRKTESDLEPITERWTGLRMENLRSCAARANKNPHAGSGVVVLATGKERAGLLLKCVRMQLVNQLLCDEDLSIELERLLKIADGV